MDKIKALAKERGARLRQVRDFANLSRKELSELSGKGASTIQFWENGESQGLPQPEAKNLVEVFHRIGVHCDLGWLFYGSGSEPTRITPSTGTEATLFVNNPDFKQETECFYRLYPEGILLHIEDDAMLPFYALGDWVGSEKKYTGESIVELIGKHCIIELRPGEMICRILRLADNRKDYQCVATNPATLCDNAYIVQSKIISASPVNWIRRGI